jgi:hypothetical protein
MDATSISRWSIRHIAFNWLAITSLQGSASMAFGANTRSVISFAFSAEKLLYQLKNDFLHH